MKIGLDARELKPKKAGKGWYVHHVLKNILQLDESSQYYLYSDTTIDFPDFKNAKKIILPKKGLRWHFAMPKQLVDDKIDLYWAPTSPIVPALSNIPTVMTIHDLTNLLFPDTHTLKGRIVEKFFLGRALKKTKKVISDSNATSKDIIRLFPFAKQKIRLTYLGYDKCFKSLDTNSVAKVINKYQLKPGYILFLGTIEPRKNISMLAEAFAKLDSKTQEQHPLVIVGKKGWKYEQIFQRIDRLKVKDKIKFLDYAAFDDLPAIYNGCEVFVFPSLYEGFGLPPLEAMACGKPVIVSNISSLPEVVGDAGIKVNPKDSNKLATEIKQILNNPSIAAELSKKSLEQAKKFDWESTARETLKVINDIFV